MRLRTGLMFRLAWFASTLSLLGALSGETPKDLEVVKPFSASRVQSPWGILGVIREVHSQAKIAALFSADGVVFCLFEVRSGEEETYMALVSPRSEGRVTLKIGDADKSEKVEPFNLRTYGQLATQDGVVDDESVVTTHEIGVLFSVPRFHEFVFSAFARSNEGAKSWVIQRSETKGLESKVFSEVGSD